MISTAGKFAAPSIWYPYIRKFFEARKYELEGESGFEEACKISMEKYREWEMRIKEKI